MQHLKQQQPQGREGGQLEGREEQLGAGKEERRGSCRTATMKAAAAGQERLEECVCSVDLCVRG